MTYLPAIPPNWEVVEFGRTLEKGPIRVGKVSKADYKPHGSYPIVDQGQAAIGGYTDDASLLYAGELPVVVFGDHTRVFKFIRTPFVCGADGTRVLVPNRSLVDPEFYFFALTHLEIPSRGYNRHFKLLFEKELMIPPLQEQKRIAHVLGAVQEAIAKQEAVIAAARELKRSLMHRVFTYGPYAEERPTKETEIGEMPAEWEVANIADLAKVRYGKAKPPTAGRIPVVGSGGVYAWTDQALVDFPTLVVGRKGTAGKVWLFHEPFWPADTTFYLEWTCPVDVDFVHGYLTLNPLSGEHAKTTLPSLLRSDLENCRVPLPPRQVQEGIAHVLGVAQRKIEVEVDRGEALKALFDSLLQQVMTGRVRVPPNSVTSAQEMI